MSAAWPSFGVRAVAQEELGLSPRHFRTGRSQFSFEPIALATASINGSAENGLSKNATQSSSVALAAQYVADGASGSRRRDGGTDRRHAYGGGTCPTGQQSLPMSVKERAIKFLARCNKTHPNRLNTVCWPSGAGHCDWLASTGGQI